MIKILVIEDNHDVRENLQEILELSGYEVAGAKDGKEGIQMAESWQPDLIVCDIMLPVIDGFGVLQILSKKAELKHIPFIFLTAKTELSDIRKGMNLGADDYITKPFKKDELLAVIELRLTKARESNSVTQTESRLKNLSRAHSLLRGIFENADEKEYPPDFELYSSNEHPKNAFFLDEGLLKETLVHHIGRDIILRLLSRGSYPGVWEAYQNVPYTTNCITLSSCKIKFLPINQFLEAIQNEPFSVQAIQDMLRNQKVKTEEKVLGSAYNSVRQKVAHALEECLNNGLGTQGSPISLSRADLASICGIAKETLTRTLSDFKSENLIEIKSGNIVVVSEAKIRKLLSA
ncbi:MAG: response regulator [Saprospirales bacterium]|nr:MAG: response regulator [Saprospirales bacterium]